MDLWAYTNGVILDFSRRGKPTDNAAIESFNGRFRDECLNVHWFASLEDAQQKIDAFRWDYNEHHPHRSLKGLSPREFAERMLQTAAGSVSESTEKWRPLGERWSSLLERSGSEGAGQNDSRDHRR